MKTLKSMNISLPKSDPLPVRRQAMIGYYKEIDEIMSDQLTCAICGGIDHYTVYSTEKEYGRVWICANGFCKSNNVKSTLSTTSIPPHQIRAVLWPLFCELSGIGDINHNVKFEDIKQNQKKIDYLAKFAQNPHGIIVMQGDKGLGKTYAAMAVCELYTRTKTSAVFLTNRGMLENWLSEKNVHYIEKWRTADILVIDDFGTTEPTPGFMGFFMDLINTRMQWTNRGTIITTNLDDKKMSQFCGVALSDRLQMGVKFTFEGSTRRKQLTL